MLGPASQSPNVTAAGKPARAHARPVAAQFAWQDERALLAALDTGPAGLDEEQIEDRLDRDGANEAVHEKPTHWLLQLAHTFKNPFIIVLLVLAAVQLFTSDDPTGPIIIAVMVGISVVLSFTQEFRSSRAAEKLKAMVRNTATVTRRASDGHSERIEVPVIELVAGDIVHLSAGDMVPADLRLLAAKDLFISQAILTGESIPVEKAAPEHAQKTDPHAEPLDLPTVCYMGTNVVSGSATAVVVTTGPRSYLGSLARALTGPAEETSFDRGVKSVSWLLIRFMAVMVPIVFLIQGFGKGNWLEAFLFAISVAVGLTPEMLPLIVTANLAKGALAMSKRKVVVKQLNAIQNFGAMDVLCTDKTGTLTLDKIVLEQHLDLDGEESDDALEFGYLNSHFQTGLKNLMDKAVLAHRDLEHSIAKWTVVDEIPFDFQRRRMSVVLEPAGDASTTHEEILVCKGAVEEMLSICAFAREGGRDIPMTDHRRDTIRAMTHGLNEDGLRVLIVAVRRARARGHAYGVADEQGLTAIGCLAFLDPPKDTAHTAIAALHQHGVAVKVITGDNAAVTGKICREVGLDVAHSMLGRDLEDLDDTAFDEAVRRTTVFAKMSPLQKSRVVTSLQRQGHTVGFLGDGINDAPALRAADVGISVDTATDIAKESADIILLEKNLMVLEEGVLEGRITFGNIIKYIKMTASSNFGNVFSMLIASIFLPFLPMLPLQILVLNLLYDISQLSIPFDRMDEEYVRKPRKWDASDISRFMIRIGPTSSLFDITTFLLLWFWFGANSVAHQSLFQSGWFVESLLTQTLVVHMIRTRRIPFLQSSAAAPVLGLTTAIIAIGIALPYTALGRHLGMVELPLEYFGWLAATVVAYCVLTQFVKVIYMRRFARWL
ncbi:MAG: magnesium-translocating P-type ATPase [Rhodanobacteraceae bacterium]